MTKLTYKRLALLFVKYSPALMAIVCSIKLFVYYLGHYTIVHYINVFLNIFIVGGIYTLGRTFGYCWKHRSLCRTAFWGYVVYAVALAAGVSDKDLLIPAALYIILVLIMALLYRSI